MTGHIAGGVRAAHAGTRVHTMLIDTRLVPGTLGVDHALRLTFHVGVAHVVPDAGAAEAETYEFE